ncbi:MAG: LD-carboxypeptidase [Crocinitomicaceae bacterium]|nr:LD-carboxypeptidase [Crocinitomicaceae bacterium]
MEKISRRSFVPMLGTALIGASCLSIQDPVKLDELAKDIIRPNALKKGDLIAICAPAGGTRNFDNVVEFKSLLENYGYNVQLGDNVYGAHGYFSANDESRAKSFMDLIKNPEVKAIFFTRGGWGCARILEHLDFDIIQKNPKIIMGFSDITTLLNAISYKTGLVTYHGPGGNSSWNDFSWNSIKHLLIDKAEVNYYHSNDVLQEAPVRTIVSGMAEGQLFGGNLSVLSGLIGSEYLPDWKGKILFLEDVMEEPYRIDRMLTHLKLNGIFDQINGVILGQFRKCDPEEPDRSFTIHEVFDQHFSHLKIPVYSGAAIGHIRHKHTVPIGLPIRIDSDQQSFELLHAAVI